MPKRLKQLVLTNSSKRIQDLPFKLWYNVEGCTNHESGALLYQNDKINVQNDYLLQKCSTEPASETQPTASAT